MKDSLIKSFDRLIINDKRNEISNELLAIAELINSVKKNYDLKPLLNVKNYNRTTDSKLSESEMLTFLYQNVYDIEKNLIDLIAVTSYLKK